MKKLISFFSVFTLLAAIAFIIPTSNVEAWNGNSNGYTDFGSCPNPGGSAVASYNDGWHWIIGNSKLQWGSDFVYAKGNNNYVQCYCPQITAGFTPDYKTGIQTNWLKVTDKTKSDKMTGLGWIYVADGSAFGLGNGPYLAKNIPFNCGGGSGCQTTINQSNSANVTNTVNVKLNTGDNSINGNTGGTTHVETGSVVSNVSITNDLNKNVAEISGCNGGCSNLNAVIKDYGAGSINSIKSEALNTIQAMMQDH